MLFRSRARRKIKKPGAGQQIVARAGLGKSAHESGKKMLFHERLAPHGCAFEQGDNFIRMRCDLGFQRPPNQQRLTTIVRIALLRNELLNDLEAFL